MPGDIYNSVLQFIELHGNQIKAVAKRYMPEGSISFDKEYLCREIPVLGKLIWLLESDKGV